MTVDTYVPAMPEIRELVRQRVPVAEIERRTGWSEYAIRRMCRDALPSTFTNWSDAEKATVRPALSKAEAVTLYRARFGDRRSDGAITTAWNRQRREILAEQRRAEAGA